MLRLSKGESSMRYVCVTTHITYITSHEVFLQSLSIFCTIPVCTTLILSTVCLMTAYYVVLCTMFSVLMMLRTSVYLHVWDQRETAFQSCLMFQLTIKLTLTHPSKRPLSLNRLWNNTSTRGQRKVVSSDNNEHGSSGGGYDNVPVKKVSPQKNSTIIEISTSCPMAI